MKVFPSQDTTASCGTAPNMLITTSLKVTFRWRIKVLTAVAAPTATALIMNSAIAPDAMGPRSPWDNNCTALWTAIEIPVCTPFSFAHLKKFRIIVS